VLHDLGERLARHIGAREQRIAGGRPGIDAALQHMQRSIAEGGEATARLLGDTVAVVEQYDPAAPPRHQASDQQFKAAVGQVDGEQRMPGAVLALFPQIEECHFADVAERR